MTYKTKKYIADLQLDKIPADNDWKGVKNPLTVYDRIDTTKERFEYPNLIEHYLKISANGKKSLGAALFEWIVNRVGKHFGGDITIYYPIIQAYWASSIDIRYGGCNVPDLDYELIINHSERSKSDTNWVSSQWAAKGDIENILHTAIAFTANLENVDGAEEWLKRLYYLALYLLPDDLKPLFQKWFTTILERLGKYTPARNLTAAYEDVFDEHWVENRGLPVPPQLLDPEFDYNPNQNTELVDKFIRSCDYSENQYLRDLEKIMDDNFEGEPYTFKGVIYKEKKSVDLKSLVSGREDLSSMQTVPTVIKISSKQIDPEFEYDDELYTDDRDEYVVVQNDKLAKILEKIKGKAQFGFTLATSEWIVNILRDSTKTEKLEQLLEAMWAKIDQNYIKPDAIDHYTYDEDEDNICVEEDDEEDYDEEGDNIQVIHGLYEILAGANNLYIKKSVDSSDLIHIIILARNMYEDKSIFDAWIHNVINRILVDYPQITINENNDDDERKLEDEISNTPCISRDYYFNPEAIYNETSAKDELNTFINKLDFSKNQFLPSPEEVYLLSFVRNDINENPYNKDSKFNKEITADQIAELGNKFRKIESTSYHSAIKASLDKSLAMKCFEMALEINQNCRLAYAFRGLHLYEARLYEKATLEFTKAISFKLTSGGCYYLGECYYELEEYDKAYDAFLQAIELDESLREERPIKKLSNHLATKAYEANETNEFELCIELANKSLKLNPKNQTAYLNRAAGYGNIKNDPEAKEKAKADVEMARQLDPKGAAVSYSNEGLNLINEGKYNEAIEKANMALQLDAKLAHGYFIRGYAYGSLKNFDKAIEDMSKSIELDPKGELVFINRAYYYRALGRYNESIADYNQAEKIVSNNYKTLLFDNRAKTYAAMGKFDKALEDLLAAYNHSKSLDELVYTAYGYASNGNIAEAKKQLDKASKMEGDVADSDRLVWLFTQYALQINMDETIKQCKEIMEQGYTNENYPLGNLVKIAIANGHPDPKILTEVAIKIKEGQNPA